MSTKTFLQADADSRDVWLVTTDAYAFYEVLGFATVRSFIVGNDNPTWVKAPITVRVVSRNHTKAAHSAVVLTLPPHRCTDLGRSQLRTFSGLTMW